MQETFLRVIEDPSRFERRSSPATFLFGVATHLCLNRLRNRAARGGAWLDGLTRSLEAPGPSAGDAVEARQLATAILAETDEVTAAIALFHHVDGLPQGEVAALVGLSRVTVNQRLHRFKAQARLREELP